MEKITVQRFSLGVRITHWVHGILILTFMITGLGIYWGSYLWGDYAQNISLHMILSFVLLMVGVLHLYIMSAITGDIRDVWVHIKDIKDTIMIAQSWLGISKKYPEYGTYDVEKKRFYGKYHPVVKMKYWADTWFVGFAAISGFAMYYSNVLGFLNSIGIPFDFAWMRAIHFLVFIYFVVSLSGHIYLSIIPVNWEVLKSMVTGKEEVEPHIE